MRGSVAIAAVAIVALALGLASVWPWLARVMAIAGMLLLPPTAVAVALHRSFFGGRWLRASAFAVGLGSALVALGAAAVTIFPGAPLGSLWLGDGVRERTVEWGSGVPDVMLTVRAPARGDGRKLRLTVSRGEQERTVGLSLDPPADGEGAAMGLDEPILTRRAAVAVPGEGALRFRLPDPDDGEGPRIDVVVTATSRVRRHTLPVVGGLSLAGLAAQWVAGRRRVRSWLLLGSWTALAFALRAPTAWDPSQPGWTASGILLFSALAGGGAATALSYLIERMHDSRRQGAGPTRFRS